MAMANKVYPRTGDTQTIYLKNIITNPNIEVGDYTIYNDFVNDPKEFQNNNVLYHYPINQDKLIIGKFCSIACGTKFLFNSANRSRTSLSTYSFPIFFEEWGLPTDADSIAKTDALITDEPGLPLLLCFADCTPILLLDPAHRAVGIAHGGWKGTVRRIAAKTVLRMQREFGTRPEDVLAAIGPSIGPCCYEVGSEVERQFQEAFSGHEAALFSHPDAVGGTHLSLWAANCLQLEEIGVLREHIDEARTCTACHHEDFFSYRADGGQTGRLGAVIALRS